MEQQGGCQDQYYLGLKCPSLPAVSIGGSEQMFWGFAGPPGAVVLLRAVPRVGWGEGGAEGPWAQPPRSFPPGSGLLLALLVPGDRPGPLLDFVT